MVIVAAAAEELVLGYAFQRTRSLALPTLLHAAHNFLLFAAIWHFNQ